MFDKIIAIEGQNLKFKEEIIMAENAPVQGQSKAPSIVCMATGIASIVLCYCWGLGIVAAIVSFVFGGKCKNSGIQNGFTKVGKITSIIGLILSIICTVLLVIGLALGAK